MVALLLLHVITSIIIKPAGKSFDPQRRGAKADEVLSVMIMMTILDIISIISPVVVLLIAIHMLSYITCIIRLWSQHIVD